MRGLFWTICPPRETLVVAAPFGFGPRSAADLYFRIHGQPLLPWRDAGDLDRASVSVTRHVYNFGVTGETLADLEKIVGAWSTGSDLPTHNWIDCLMWLRAALPPLPWMPQAIYAETFFPTRHCHKRSYPPVQDIRPLADLGCPKPRDVDGAIVVTFGGIDTPFSTDVHRFSVPVAVVNALRKNFQFSNSGRRVVCCVPKHFAPNFLSLVSGTPITVLSPSRVEFLDLLSSAALVITQPGLYGPFEIFGRGIPTVFTPPATYTQLAQAIAFESNGIAGELPLLQRIADSVGPIEGNIEDEEPKIFIRLAKWLESHLESPEVKRTLTEWAGWALSGALVDPDLTARRLRFARIAVESAPKAGII